MAVFKHIRAFLVLLSLGLLSLAAQAYPPDYWIASATFGDGSPGRCPQQGTTEIGAAGVFAANYAACNGYPPPVPTFSAISCDAATDSCVIQECAQSGCYNSDIVAIPHCSLRNTAPVWDPITMAWTCQRAADYWTAYLPHDAPACKFHGNSQYGAAYVWATIIDDCSVVPKYDQSTQWFPQTCLPFEETCQVEEHTQSGAIFILTIYDVAGCLDGTAAQWRADIAQWICN